MSVLDRLLNAMKLNDDDMGGDGYLDEPDDGYGDEPVPGRRRIVKERDADEELFSETQEAGEEPKQAKSAVRKRSAGTFRRTERNAGSDAGAQGTSSSRVGSRLRKRPETELAVCVIRPHSMEDAREITDTLREKCAVVLNVENLELELAQRILDFTSGSCYAIDGNLQKISNYIFIITPASIEISGDFQEILSGAFDVPFESQY